MYVCVTDSHATLQEMLSHLKTLSMQRRKNMPLISKSLQLFAQNQKRKGKVSLEKHVKMTFNCILGWLEILNSNPKPSTNMQYEVILTCY